MSSSDISYCNVCFGPLLLNIYTFGTSIRWRFVYKRVTTLYDKINFNPEAKFCLCGLRTRSKILEVPQKLYFSGLKSVIVFLMKYSSFF